MHNTACSLSSHDPKTHQRLSIWAGWQPRATEGKAGHVIFSMQKAKPVPCVWCAQKFINTCTHSMPSCDVDWGMCKHPAKGLWPELAKLR